MDKSYFEQLKQLVGRSNRVRANFLKVEDKAKVLVLPITPQTVVPRFQHWIGKRSVVCLKTFNKECPICLEKGEQPQKQLLFSVLPLKGEEIDFQIHIMPTPPSFLSLIDDLLAEGIDPTNPKQAIPLLLKRESNRIIRQFVTIKTYDISKFLESDTYKNWDIRGILREPSEEEIRQVLGKPKLKTELEPEPLSIEEDLGELNIEDLGL